MTPTTSTTRASTGSTAAGTATSSRVTWPTTARTPATGCSTGTGAYNLYTHCNAAYGGFNDVRQFSPDMQTFLQTWAFTLGAGLVPDDVTDSSTSAFNELALVYQSDIKDHGSGKAFPSTPGHFDDPNACAP